MGPDDSSRRLAVVTGASSGIGLALAHELARNDFDVVVAAEDPELDAAAAEVERHGGSVHAVRVDLATAEGVDRLADEVRRVGRPVDALLVNAGVGVSGPFVGSDLDAHLALIELNVTGAVRLVRLLLPDMVDRGEGRVMFTSSIAATMPGPYMSTYSASKAFLYSFAQSLRAELHECGVSVTALMPGPTESEFFERADMEDTRLGQSKKDDPAEVAHDGFQAMMAGKDHVIAGSIKNRAQVAAAKVTRDPVLGAAHRRLSGPGSGQ